MQKRSAFNPRLRTEAFGCKVSEKDAVSAREKKLQKRSAFNTRLRTEALGWSG